MEIEQAVYGLLAADTTLAGLVSNRIYPEQAPEGSRLPLVVYMQASRKAVMTYGGPKKLNSYSMRFEVYGLGKRQVKEVARVVRDRLNGFRGVTGGLFIQGIFDETEASGLEAPIHADEFGIYGQDLAFSIWYRADATARNTTTTAT